MNKLLPGAIGALLLATPLAVGAAPITRTFDFTASGFVPGSAGVPTPVPHDPVTGSFTVTFDTTVDVADTASGLSGSLSIPATAIGWRYVAAIDQLAIGGLLNTVDTIVGDGNDDFFLVINAASTSAGFGAFAYTLATTAFTNYAAERGTVTAREVPEPATLALLAMGVLGAGTGVRRRRT